VKRTFPILYVKFPVIRMEIFFLGRNQHKTMKRTNLMKSRTLQIVGDNLLSAGTDSEMTIWDRKLWNPVRKLEGHADWVNSIAVDEKRGIFCTASDDKTVRVWDMKTKECLHVLGSLKDKAHSIAISDSQLFIGCMSNIYVWDMETWKMTHRLTNHSHVLRAMSDGKQVIYSIPGSFTCIQH
jgi:WD40 repeat protein